jgi:hypothetical protein
MNNKELITKLQAELYYTQIETNIKKLYEFLQSEVSKSITDYHRVLLETQLNAMNIYRNSLILRIADLNQNDTSVELKDQTVGENEGTSN